MRKYILFLFLIAALGGLFLSKSISEFYSTLIPRLPQLERDAAVLVKEVKEKISAPPPLIVEVRLPESFLTQAGVIQWTNIERQKQGLPALRESQELNESSLVKTQDMLDKQYFGHISPAGQGVGDLANEVSYEFIAIGENLALGDFENDEKLLQGWMQSPGHRENILSSHYQEIGVAVLKGEFQGRETWLAVQHFGKPLSTCPQPPDEILTEIKEKQNQIEELYFILSALEQELRDFRSKREPAYNQKVEEYNAKVARYNALVEETKLLIAKYNNQVMLFNECAKG